MLYPLYEYYTNSSLDLYEVRNHFLEHFYYQNHSRNRAENILRTIISSSKIARILDKSARYKVMPSYEDFLIAICSMLKFVFSSNDTIVLATMDAAILWDIEVNAKLHLVSPEESKQNILRVFNKYQIYKEMPKQEFDTFVPNVESANGCNLPKLKTWNLTAFSREFGNMKVEEYVNNDTGELFHSCVFTNGYTRTFVNFSSKLGELTKEEISKEEDNLVVVQLPNGKYKLARKGKGY